MSFYQFGIYPKTGSFMLREAFEMLDADRAVDNLPLEKIPDQVECPIVRTRNILYPAYEQAKMLMHLDMGYNDGNGPELMTRLEQVGNAANVISEALQKTLMKLEFMHKLFDSRYAKYFIFKSYRDNAGIIIRNIPRLIKDGYNNIPYDITTVPMLDHYRSNKVAQKLIDAKEGLLKSYVDLSVIDTLSPYDNERNPPFSSFTDMMSCFFDDLERLARLETKSHYEYTAEYLSDNATECADMPVAWGDDMQAGRLVQYIGETVTAVKQAIYCAEDQIMDGVMEPKAFTNQMRCIINMTVNMFNICTMVAISNAYNIRRSFDRKNAVDDYVATILPILRPAK